MNTEKTTATAGAGHACARNLQNADLLPVVRTLLAALGDGRLMIEPGALDELAPVLDDLGNALSAAESPVLLSASHCNALQAQLSGVSAVLGLYAQVHGDSDSDALYAAQVVIAQVQRGLLAGAVGCLYLATGGLPDLSAQGGEHGPH